jgi:hypothetical protein
MHPADFSRISGGFYYLSFNGIHRDCAVSARSNGPSQKSFPMKTTILLRRKRAARCREIDSRYVREHAAYQGGIKKVNTKPRRKLHDVIIVLWECLSRVERIPQYRCCTLWELLLQILQSLSLSISLLFHCFCSAVNSHVAFTCVPAKPNFFFACVSPLVLSGASAPLRGAIIGPLSSGPRDFSRFLLP